MDSVESGLPGSSGNSGSSGPPGPTGYSTSTRTGHPAELIYVEDPVYYKFQDNEKSYKGRINLRVLGSSPATCKLTVLN